jgi:hypothetical protein
MLAQPHDEDRPKKKVNTNMYKTNLCRTFSRTGSCPYGPKCQFAHGEADLRPVPREAESPKDKDLAASSPMVAQALYAGANNKDVVSPRIAMISMEGALSPIDHKTFSLSPKVVDQLTRKTPSSPSLIAGSPRVALLNLASGVSATDKPIPEGARVDCDPKLYKTELCRGFSRDGSCRYGANCQFAHGIEELRPAPQGASKVIKISLENSISEDTSFIRPSSPAFEHGADGALPSLNIPAFNEISSPKRSNIHESCVSPKVKDPRVYKTELCQKFEETGSCPYGLKCQFAHGNKELRSKASLSPITSPQQHISEISTEPLEFDLMEEEQLQKKAIDSRLYKTELCRSFNRTGYCRYGLRCQFAHGIHELRASPRLINAALKIGIEMTSSVQSELVSEHDSEYSPASPRNLSGSAVIQSPTQRDLSPKSTNLAASPTAKLAFSFPTPITFDEVSKISTKSSDP